MRKSIVLALLAGAASLFSSSAAQATDAFWTTLNGNWGTQNAASAGWAGTLPDAIGDSANWDDTGKASITVTQELAGTSAAPSNRTVGKIAMTGTANASWQITLTGNSGTNSYRFLTMNQDGAGPLTAIISNETTAPSGSNGNPGILINNSGGGAQLVLADDLLITNTSTSTRASGAIAIDAQLTGAGNITFSNVSNNIDVAPIALFRTGAGSSNFAGNSTIAKGAVTFNRGDRFTPTPGNVITIGSATNGDATLAYLGGGPVNMENNFVAAAGTGGTNVLAARCTTAGAAVLFKSTNSYASSINLLGDLTVSNLATNASIVTVGNPVIGAGKLTKAGPGLVRISNGNSYTGGTEVSAGSLAVSHDVATSSIFGSYVATDGTLGTGNVLVKSSATSLQIESSVAAINTIANTATLTLEGGGTLDVADNGFADLGAGVNETVGGLVFGTTAQAYGLTFGSTGSSAVIKSDEYFAGTGALTVGLAGDYNHNNEVDAADYVKWQANPSIYGGTAGYDLWRQNFGNAIPGAGPSLHASQGVPEPSAMLLLAVAGALAAGAARRRG